MFKLQGQNRDLLADGTPYAAIIRPGLPNATLPFRFARRGKP
jgi:hypothetical protein